MKIILHILLIILCIGCKKNAHKTDPDPIPANDDILAKGVNLSNWFNDYSDPAQFGNRFSLSTLQFIKSNGFTYVRIPIGVTILFNAAQPEQLNSSNLSYVDAAIDNSIKAGLGVTINLHAWQNDADIKLANDPSFGDKMAAYWKAVANYFKKYSADKLFFEVYNEPHASAAGLTSQGYSWWQPVQEKMIRAIREATADHSIIVGGEGWNSIGGL
ncbi:MAG: cellulase family glycosylhydrolase, partial [Ginsengibacter sp.]